MRSLFTIHELRAAILCLLFLLGWQAAWTENPATETLPRIASLSHNDPDLRTLKGEIRRNLRSVATGGKLAVPLRYFEYEVRESDSFFLIMGLVEQDADTLASVNGLVHTADIAPGQILRIPNARGLFVPETNREEIARRFNVGTDRLHASGDGFFLPGRGFATGELRYFRGDGWRSPLSNGRVSSRYGGRMDPFSNRWTFHGGLDIAAPTGTTVTASRNGEVVRAGTAGGYGKLVVVKHEFGYSTYYGHLSSIHVRVGQKVMQGQTLGRVGQTGRATGPHLHFEVRKNGERQNPMFVHLARS